MARSVAIIEPDTNVASVVEQAFHNMGFEAHVLVDGDVVEFVRQRAPVVIVLNVELPKGSGYSFCNRLKKQQDLKRIPIILTSGQETPEAFAQHSKTPTPADAYIHKPFSIDQLLDAVGRLLPEDFPNGAPVASQGEARSGPAAAPAAGADDVPAPSGTDVRPPAVTGAPPPRTRIRPEARGAAGPTFDELLNQGRHDEAIPAPTASAGPEAKLVFLRESLRRREGDVAKARELWAQREREMGQLAEMLDLRERELERARKAREDLLAQLTAAEDRIGTLRLDIELGTERGERLEREKKALTEELESATDDAEREVEGLTGRNVALEDALKAEQSARAAENDRSSTEIHDLVNDLEAARSDFARKDAAAKEREAGLNRKIADQHARIAQLDVQLETSKGNLDDSAQDAAALRRELGILSEKKHAEDAAFHANIDDLDSRVRDLTLDKEGLEADLQKTSADLQDTKARLEDRSNRVVDLEADLADNEGQLIDVRGQLEVSETRAAEGAAELQDTQQHALELAQEKHRLEQKIVETSGNLLATSKRFDETAAELDDTRKKATTHARELEARIGEVKVTLAEREGRLNEASASFAMAQATLLDTETRLADKTREWDQERFGRQKDVLKRDQRIADIEGKNKELDSSLHDSERQAKTREAALSHEFDAARARGEELDRDLNRARAKTVELDGQVQDAKERINELTRELRKAEAQLHITRDEILVLTERIDETSQQYAEQKEQNAFMSAELSEERANHSQDVQAHGANLDRVEKGLKERVEKLQEGVARLKADLGGTQGELADTRVRLQRADENKARLEGLIERETRDRQALADRIGVLDDEIEGAQANNEKLTDELTRMRTHAKRAGEDAAAVKREKAGLESQFAEKEDSLFKKMEEHKTNIADEKQKGRAELDAARRERDEVKIRYTELRQKADTLLKRAKDGETSAKERADSADLKLHDMVNEIRVEKEARARERAQAEGAQEKLQKLLTDATLKSSSDSDVKLDDLRTEMKSKDERLAKATLESSHYREKARDAIAKAKELSAQLQTSANDADDTPRKVLEEVKGKYNEAVTRLKGQAEMNKQINDRYRDLAEKHRKALAIIDELKRRVAGSAVPVPVPTPVQAAASFSSYDGEDDAPAGESTLVLENPFLKK